jgi:DNA mismatch repair protein MutL
MPPDLVDVNVHPTKLEVRFQDSGRVYSLLLGSLRKRFLATDLTARVHTAASGDEDPAAAAHDPAATENQRRELVEWAKGQLASGEGTSGGSSFAAVAEEDEQAALELQFDKSPEQMLHLNRIDRSWAAVGGPHAYSGAAKEPPPSAAPAPPPRVPGARAHLGFQIHNRYLVTENDAGMVVIDQHALHERVLYEQIRSKVLSGRMESQRLLVPEPVSLSPAETAAALEAKETLAKLGLEIEPFGGDTIVVSSYPAMLANINPAELLRQVVDGLLSGGKSLERRDLLDELLHMVACKAAIKAGDYLAPEEITALLEQRQHYQDTHHCPHGRPTALVFTREELDKRFKRT